MHHNIKTYCTHRIFEYGQSARLTTQIAGMSDDQMRPRAPYCVSEFGERDKSVAKYSGVWMIYAECG